MLDEQTPEATTTTETPAAAPPEPAGPAASGEAAPPAKKTAAKKAAAKKAATKKSTAKKATGEPAPADQPDGEPSATKSTAKKAAAKKSTSKKAAAKKAAPKPEPTADEAPAQDPGEAAPATIPLFQPPDPVVAAPRKRAAKKAATKPAPDAEQATGEAAADGATAPADTRADTGPDPGDDTGADEGDGTARRRRRRGGRRRRKGPGEGGETGSDAEGATDSAEDQSTDQKDEGADEESAESGSGESTSTRRRRRRRRTGDGEQGDSDDPENTVTRVRKPRSAEDEITGFSGSTRLEAKKQRRREGREAGRRRAPIISEAEFLARREAVDRKMVIRQRGDLTQIAVLEDKVLVEHYVARESQTSLIGNVYLGRVQNVLPSMEAAFIDIGKGRNAVLYAGEVNWDALGARDGNQRKIEQVLKSGQSVLVQVTKDPVGHKGARLTSQISLPGRFLVYVPNGNTSGISRKLPDNERNRLKNLLKEIVPETAGVIVRTAAEGASESELTRDVERLKALWEDISAKVDGGASAPQLLYAEPDLTLKVVRDLFTEDIAKLVVSGDEAWDMVDGYVKHVAPDLEERLERHDDSERDAFAEYRIDEQIAKALDRKVWLPSGGSLVIDRTEAMTVVDVNTGKFTGSGGNLEETVTKNNLEAAEEIVRQLRLRDIGGIIVIDFIDMVLESNRDLVLRRLIECLGRDRTRHQVAEVTSLGLVQMTRKRIGTGLLEAFSETCEHCKGRGLHVHQEPVEPRKRPADDEPRRTRRPRGKGRSGEDRPTPEPAEPAKVPTPAEFAAMARADAQRHESEQPEQAEQPELPEQQAERAEQAEQPAEQPEPEQPVEPAAEQPVAEEPEPEPPAPPAPPAPPRIVTSVRRVGVHRPAGPPASQQVQPEAHDGAQDGAQGEPVEEPVGAAVGQPHVPIKKKGARKR